MEAVLIIPARYGSTRLPGKPLKHIHGVPLIEKVLKQAQLATRFSQILVATDDVRVADAVEKAGGRAIMTNAEYASGSDRVAEVALELRCDIVVNLQGDEPFVEPADLDAVADALAMDGAADIATLRQPILDERDFIDPNVVKVVCDERGYALYFSRAALPYHQDGSFEGAYQHIGVYAYRRDFLHAFSSHESTPLEKKEGLEQLRALQMGARIRVLPASSRTQGVDTPEDLTRAEERVGMERRPQ